MVFLKFSKSYNLNEIKQFTNSGKFVTSWNDVAFCVTCRRSDWHPHNMMGISDWWCRIFLIHLLLTLYSDSQSGQTPDQTNKQWHMTCHKKCHISVKCDSILPGVGPTGIHTIWREHLAGAAEVPGSICFWHYTVRWGHWFCNRVETHRPPGRTMAEPNHRRGSLQQKSNIL